MKKYDWISITGFIIIGVIIFSLLFIYIKNVLAYENLVLDPSFELQDGSWYFGDFGSEYSTEQYHTGSYSTKIWTHKATPNFQGYIYQEHIPIEAGNYTYSFWLRFVSSTITTRLAGLYANICEYEEIEIPRGQELQSIPIDTCANEGTNLFFETRGTSTEWTKYSYNITFNSPNNYALVQFVASSAIAYTSNYPRWYVDDVSLEKIPEASSTVLNIKTEALQKIRLWYYAIIMVLITGLIISYA